MSKSEKIIDLEKDSDGTYKVGRIYKSPGRNKSEPINRKTKVENAGMVRVSKSRSREFTPALNPLEVIGNLAMREFGSETKRLIKRLFRP